MNKQILIPKTKLALSASEKATIRQAIPNLTDRDWKNNENPDGIILQ